MTIAIMMPSASFANTSELEAKKIELMKQLIVLLEQKVQQLEFLLAEKNGHVLGMATSTSLTVGATEKTKKKRRRGGSVTRSSHGDKEESVEPTTEEVVTTIATSTASSTNNVSSTDNDIDTEISSTTASSTEANKDSKTETDTTQATSTTTSTTALIVPSCKISSDKNSYTYNELVILTWESTNTVRAYFETDFGGKDYMTPPGNGIDIMINDIADMPANILGNPTIQLNVVSADGVERNCSVQFAVDHIEPIENDSEPTNKELQTMVNDLLAQIAKIQEGELDSNTDTKNTPQTELESLLSQARSLVEAKQNGTSTEPDVKLQEMVRTLLVLIEMLQKEEKPTTTEIDRLIDSVSKQINEAMQEVNNNPSLEREEELQEILDSLLALMAILHKERDSIVKPATKELQSMINQLLAQIAILQEEKLSGNTTDTSEIDNGQQAALNSLIAQANSLLQEKQQGSSSKTDKDLQEMINSLLEQIAALQKELGANSSDYATGICPYSWTHNLGPLSTGPDVMKLQQFLNSDSDTRVAVIGEGSTGNETETYSLATAKAVAKFQVKYREDTLTPIGEVNPSGVFDSITRAKANSLCSPAFDPNSEKG